MYRINVYVDNELVDAAEGNTRRTAIAAANSVARSYENDGCKVDLGPCRKATNYVYESDEETGLAGYPDGNGEKW